MWHIDPDKPADNCASSQPLLLVLGRLQLINIIVAIIVMDMHV